MSIIRLIHIQLDPSENEKAEQVWKTECAPLMIQQKGCISEKLLRAKAAGEFISYSEWESEQDIERTFILCGNEQRESRRHMSWRNMPEEDAHTFFRSYKTQALQVSEILRSRGWW